MAVLGVQGIGGDDGVGEIDPIQQGRESGDLVAFVIDLHLAQHDTAGVCEGGEQVPCWPVGDAGAARGLAVHGDGSQRRVRLWLQARTLGQPGRHHRVQRVRVDGLQDSAKRGLTRRAPADPQPDPYRHRQVMSPFRDPHVATRSGQHRAYRRSQHCHQPVPHAPTITRVGNPGQGVQQIRSQQILDGAARTSLRVLVTHIAKSYRQR